MAAWPAEVIEERATDIADAADVLLRYQGAWRHRRVETITMLTHEQVRRQVSIDFTVPLDQREGLRISADEFVVPLALLMKRPLVHFDLRNEEQHAISLLTADQHRTLARELLYRQLDSDDAGEEVVLAAGELIEAVLEDQPRDLEPEIAALASAHGVELADFRATASVLSRYFILWAVVRGLDRRRVFKFAFDEPVGRASFVFFIGARGCTEAESYHVEVAVPADLKARRTLLVDAATGRRLAAGEPEHGSSRALLQGRGAAARGARARDRLRRRALAVPCPGGVGGVDHRPARRAAVPVLRPDGAPGHRRRRGRPGALHLGRVLGPHPAHRRAPAAAVDPRPRTRPTRRQRRRRPVRRRLDRVPYRGAGSSRARGRSPRLSPS